MLRNYVTIALRHMRRQIGYTFFNVMGLAIGLAVCLLIVLFVRYSLSFDQFHAAADRLYRVVSIATNDDGTERHAEHMPTPLAPAISGGLSDVETVVRFVTTSGTLLSRSTGGGMLSHYEERFLYVDSSFFEAFSFSLLQGDPATALGRPFDVVLTATSARRYFDDENPMGQTLMLDNAYPLTVTGVVEDAPSNSSIRFDFLSPLSTYGQINPWLYTNGWNATQPATYVLLREGASAEAVEAKLPALLAQYTDAPHVLDLRYDLEPIVDVHLRSKAANQLGSQFDIQYLYIFSITALLILIIACINYMNLATARATKRAREVGVRKVVGARRRQLAGQFLGESVLMSLLALVVALALLWLLLPVFSRLIQQDLRPSIWSAPEFWASLGAVVLGVGLLAGIYPALLLSRFRPSEVLKGQGSGGTSSGARLRKCLIVFQFTVSVALIATTFVIQHQLDYLQNKRLGLNEEQVLVLPLRTAWSAPSPVAEQPEAFRSEVQKLGVVQSISFASAVPARPTSRFGGRRTDNDEPYQVHLYIVEPSYLETLEMTMVDGQGFLDSEGEAESAVLINEAAVRVLGWDDGESPVGHVLPLRIGTEEMIVAGVVGDFHFESLHKTIEPVIFKPLGDRVPTYAVLRVAPVDVPATLRALSEVWKKFAPAHPFEYFFLDDAFAQFYQAEDRLANLFNAFTCIAILVACLGLYGLAAFTAEQRTKEIGIRKVLGATVPGIVALLSKDFLALVLLASAAAAPLAYLAMRRWLDGFAYHIEPGLGLFVLAGLLALVVAFATVSYQAYRAATIDPAKSLRYE